MGVEGREFGKSGMKRWMRGGKEARGKNRWCMGLGRAANLLRFPCSNAQSIEPS